MVRPRRDFNFNVFKSGERFSPGAVEVYVRFAILDIGRNLLTASLAEPNL